MNLLQIAGNLGSDPVTRFTASGQKVTTFNVATNTKRGENTITVWYRITIWGDRFDKMLSYLKKGSSVIVVGELQKPEIYTDKEGRQQINLEIWADIIRFSPFGKPAEQRQEQSAPAFAQTAGQGGGFSGGQGGYSGGQAGFSGGGESGFGEQTFQGGSGFGGGGFGQGKHPNSDEEDVPF